MNILGEDGYELWLRYRKVDNPTRLKQYRQAIRSIAVIGESASAEIIRNELARALPALLDAGWREGFGCGIRGGLEGGVLKLLDVRRRTSDVRGSPD